MHLDRFPQEVNIAYQKCATRFFYSPNYAGVVLGDFQLSSHDMTKSRPRGTRAQIAIWDATNPGRCIDKPIADVFSQASSP